MAEPVPVNTNRDEEVREEVVVLPSTTSVLPSQGPEVLRGTPALRPGLRPAVMKRRPPPMDSSLDDGLTTKKKPTASETKTGNHSIVTKDVFSGYAHDCQTASNDSDFITAGFTYAGTVSECFYSINNELRIRSTIVPFWMNMATRPAVTITSTAFEAFPAPPPLAANILVKRVEFKGALLVWEFEKACIATFLIDTVPNGKALTTALHSYLRPGNSQLISSIASVIYSGLKVFDNCAIYAKLLYWAMVVDYCEQNDIVMAAVPFPVEGSLVIYSLNLLNIDVTFFMGSITSGRIILVDGEDFSNQQDLQVILWLCRSGRRVNVARNERAPDLIYLDWPAIQVGLYVWQDHMPLPVAAIPSSVILFSFANRMACKRAEWDAFNKGLYLAMSMLGTRYTKPHPVNAEGNVGNVNAEGEAGGAAGDVRAQAPLAPHVSKGLTTFLSAANYEIPCPQDYSVLLRGLNKRPPFEEHNWVEALRFYNTDRRLRMHGCALLTALIRAMASTTMTSFGVTTEDLIRWFDTRQQSVVLPLIDQVFCSNEVPPDKQPEFIDLVFNMIYNCTGWTCYQSLFAGGRWVGPAGRIPDAESYYVDMPRALPPRIGSVLGIDNFLICRPLEWGVLGPNTTLDFSGDLTQGDIPDRRGYYAFLGEQKYTDGIRSPTPYNFIAYGVQGVNAIHQHFRLDAGVMSHTDGLWANGCGIPAWSRPMLSQNPIYNQALHIYEPCSIMSFDGSLPAIVAPAMVGKAVSDRMMVIMTNWNGQVVQGIGFLLRRMRDSAIYALSYPVKRPRVKRARKGAGPSSEN